MLRITSIDDTVNLDPAFSFDNNYLWNLNLGIIKEYHLMRGKYHDLQVDLIGKQQSKHSPEFDFNSNKTIHSPSYILENNSHRSLLTHNDILNSI